MSFTFPSYFGFLCKTAKPYADAALLGSCPLFRTGFCFFRHARRRGHHGCFLEPFASYNYIEVERVFFCPLFIICLALGRRSYRRNKTWKEGKMDGCHSVKDDWHFSPYIYSCLFHFGYICKSRSRESERERATAKPLQIGSQVL